jgi:anaerobic magnesium-protoporphyrin IX monomethyl ester cyclase
MKLMLIAPPVWTPTMPHLALPSLTAYLRQTGVNVQQRDLNIEAFDHVLTRDFVLSSLGRVAERRPSYVHPQSESRVRHIGRAIAPAALDWARSTGPSLANEVESAKALIKSQAFFDGARSRPAFETLMGALQLASLPYFPASLSMHTYTSQYRHDSSRALLAAVRDQDSNVFVRLFERLIMPDVLRWQPEVIGISIPSVHQVIAALTLASLVRQSGLRTHVTVGGPMITLWRELLPRVPQMFELFDSAVVFDGEEPLLRLCEAVDAGAGLDRVPNLIYRDGSVVRTNERVVPHRLSDMPTPDFDGLPLDKYLVPELVLPLATSRGCYHGRCSFCNVGYGEVVTFSRMPGNLALEQVTSVAAKHGSRHVFLVDEAITPRVARDISHGLLRLGSAVRWASCARFEPAFTSGLLQTMADGGCQMLLFGLETGSPSVAERMAKRTRLDVTRRVLGDSARAGIANHVFLFFGFPGESIEDAQATADFVYENGRHIHSTSVGTFLLQRYAQAHSEPAVFGITRIVERADADLACYFDYEVASGLDSATAEVVVERLQDVLPVHPDPQFYVNQIYRFLHCSHLRDIGQPLPLWLGATPGVE